MTRKTWRLRGRRDANDAKRPGAEIWVRNHDEQRTKRLMGKANWVRTKKQRFSGKEDQCLGATIDGVTEDISPETSTASVGNGRRVTPAGQTQKKGRGSREGLGVRAD